VLTGPNFDRLKRKCITLDPGEYCIIRDGDGRTRCEACGEGPRQPRLVTLQPGEEFVLNNDDEDEGDIDLDCN